MEICIKSKSNFKELATKLNNTADLPNLFVQEREGLNLGGGQYFLFTSEGHEIIFCRNQGEVKVDEMSN